MADEWIKMRTNLGNDPAVIAIGTALKMEEDEVVGKLHRLWSWADEHTSDGFVPRVSGTWIDRFIGRKGFASAMSDVNWLDVEPDGIVFPHFERHNGTSAKSRALDRRRKNGGKTSGDEPEEEAENIYKNSGSQPEKNTTKTGLEERSRSRKRENLNTGTSGENPNAGADASELPPDGVSPEAWAAWKRHKGRKQTPEAERLQRKHLAEWKAEGHDPNRIVETAVASGWQGLRAPEIQQRNGAHRPQSRSDKRAEGFEKLTGRDDGKRDIEGSSERLDSPSIPTLPSDLREPGGDDVGRRGPR